MNWLKGILSGIGIYILFVVLAVTAIWIAIEVFEGPPGLFVQGLIILAGVCGLIYWIFGES